MTKGRFAVCLLLFGDCQGGFKCGQESPERFKITRLQASEELDEVMVGGLTSRLVSLFTEGDFKNWAVVSPPRGVWSRSTLNWAVGEEEVWSLLEVRAG